MKVLNKDKNHDKSSDKEEKPDYTDLEKVVTFFYFFVRTQNRESPQIKRKTQNCIS